MRTQHAVRGGTRRGATRRIAVAALPVAALVLLSACGDEDEPEVEAPTTTSEAPTDTEPTTEPVESTEEPTTIDDDDVGTVDPSQGTEEPTTEEPTTEEPTTEGPTTEEPPEEGAGDGMGFAQQYVELVASGDAGPAYGMLSPEALVYFPDQTVFEENGIAGLSEDLAGTSGEPQMAIRSAYEETHDSAQVVSLWGEDDGGEPWAQTFAIRKLDGATWVVDQDITPSTGGNRLNWLNPGIQEGVDPWVISTERPMQFALLKEAGPNVAVTASIDEGDEVSQQLAEMPTEGAVIYELSDDELSDGLHVVTASWLAEDEPFVHTSATPAMNPQG